MRQLQSFPILIIMRRHNTQLHESATIQAKLKTTGIDTAFERVLLIAYIELLEQRKNDLST